MRTRGNRETPPPMLSAGELTILANVLLALCLMFALLR